MCLFTTSPACVLFGESANTQANSRTTPVPQATLLPGTEDSPPRDLIEALRTDMREASFGAARERHPASTLTGESCTEISFVLLEAKGDLWQYVGLYQCKTSTDDFQVQVIGEIRRENGGYVKKIVSAN